MLLHFSSEYRKYTNTISPDKELILFPDKPFWFIASEGCENFLDSIKDKTREQIMALPDPEQAVAEFLVSFNLAYFGEVDPCNNSLSQMDIYPLLGVWVNVDSSCNLNCKHCFLGAKSPTPNQDFLKPEDYHQFALDLLQIGGEQPVKVDITGGEPLLRPDLIEIIEAFRIKGISINVITNGLLLTDSVISHLAKNNIEITISLDGVNKEQHEFIRGANTYELTVNNIKKCTAAGISTTLTMTVHKGNQDSIIQYFELAEELGANHVNLSYLNDFGNAPVFGLELPNESESTKKLLIEAVKNNTVYSRIMGTAIGTLIETLLLPIRTDCCGSGINNCSIGANGDVYPCPSFQTENFVAGNLKKASIREIWTSLNTFSEHRKVDITTMNPVCSACDVRFFCGGGCRAQAYFTNQNDLYARSKKCSEYKKNILETMWLIDKYPILAALQTKEGAPFRTQC